MIKYTYNLGQLFALTAKENNSLVAIKYVDGSQITYKELDELSNRIAHYISHKGIVKGDVLAILNNKTFVSYAFMIACLKLGVIYTNLDPKSPIERFRRMINVCHPKFIFYSGKDSHTVIEEYENNDIITDYTDEAFKKSINEFPETWIDNNKFVTSGNPAYIMFTSGSTGFPKGVLISHANLLNFIKWTKITYHTATSDSFTNLNPMHFDNSVFDFYASLFSGATLLPITENITINPRKLLDALNILEPTIWFSVPSMLVYVLNMRALKNEDLPSLRIVTFGGEGFPKNKLRELWSKWGNRVRFVNVYGPTECTCICSSYDVSQNDMLSDDLLPLGQMSPNFSSLVLDENNVPVKNGDIGELCIGGPNVGIGYYNNPVKTKEVFIDNPIINTHSEIVYKSGDLVTYDTELDSYLFKGRKDNQIKRMGYRIELEEIENALNSVDFIHESAVIFVDNSNYKSKIIACVKSNETEVDKINFEMGRQLPSYMIPDIIMFYENLPKNQNGKIDRLSLKTDFN
jgi:D-alanine--poly(phosphoribitol) ligase subunit 1